MSIDRERLEERLRPAAVREGIVERIDPDAVRERIDAGLDPEAVRSGLDDLYVRYFLPPNVTEDEVEAGTAEAAPADPAPFDFGTWLEEGRESGPAKPPAEARVVTEATTPTVDPEADFGTFDFAGWLADGEEFEPLDVLDPEPEVPAGDVAVDPEPTDGRRLRRPTVRIHPAKAATFGLFLAVAALVALTVAGHLPALGPTGFAG